jgi:DNA repair protein RecO (recombination protein O)
MLTAEEGIIRATVFGGAKSKLRSHAAPYNSGKVWIYRDPAKDYGKLSDFDVHSWRPGLRELYERTMAASAVAETILSTHGGGGDWEEALSLSAETLDTLENANEELCERLLVHFLWRWAGFLGIQPQVECCSACGNESADSFFFFSGSENSVLCGSCVPAAESSVPKIERCPQNRALSPKIELCPQKSSSVPKNRALSPTSTLSSVPLSAIPGLLKISPGCRRWLAATRQLDSALIYRYSMDKKSLNEAKSLAAAVLTGALGKRLSSWDW